nr:YrhK family protein [Rhodovulum sp. ES.010]
MKLFQHANRMRNADTRRVYAAYELAYTLADFAAATCFIVGSVLFFWDWLETPAIWFFVLGSVMFFVKPSIRLAREIRLWRMGEVDRLARRAEGD